MQGKYIGKYLIGIIRSGCLTQVAALNRWLLKQVRLHGCPQNLPEAILNSIARGTRAMEKTNIL